MKAIHRKRLLKLAAFLAGPVARAAKRNKAKKLNMSWFANKPVIGLTKKLCGTSACALGWATLVFPKALKLQECGTRACVFMDDGIHHPTAKHIGESFFGLDAERSALAFGSTNRTIPQEVAILRKLAAGR